MPTEEFDSSINDSPILKPLDLVEIRETLQELKEIDLRKADYNVIKLKVEKLFNCGFVVVDVPERKIIYRGRIQDVEINYKHASEISYPPAAKPGSLNFNRASTNKFQIFYGALGTPDFDAPNVVAQIEVSELLDLPKNSNPDPEYIAIGQWYNRQPFRVAVLGLHSKIAEANSQAMEIRKFHSEVVQELEERGKVMNEVAEFLSKEFSKVVTAGNSFEYMISAAYGDLIFELGIGGVIFPSVKADGKAFNIAVHRNTVDKLFEINMAVVARCQLINEQPFIDYHLQSPWITNGKFKWEEPPHQAVFSPYQRKLVIDNMFLNNGIFVNASDKQ